MNPLCDNNLKKLNDLECKECGNTDFEIANYEIFPNQTNLLTIYKKCSCGKVYQETYSIQFEKSVPLIKSQYGDD